MNRGILAAAAMLTLAGCSYVEHRAADFADCFRIAAGAGIGLTADAQITSAISPGIGTAAYTYDIGWYDREIHGTWIEGTVVNTPRLAYDVFSEEYRTTPGAEFDEQGFMARLALESLNLPNERWHRFGHTVTVEHFSLFNVFGEAPRGGAWFFSDLLADPEIGVFRAEKTVWQNGFIEAGVTAVFVKARAGFNPLEAFDWLAGWFGWDPAGDDGRRPFYPMYHERDEA